MKSVKEQPKDINAGIVGLHGGTVGKEKDEPETDTGLTVQTTFTSGSGGGGCSGSSGSCGSSRSRTRTGPGGRWYAVFDSNGNVVIGSRLVGGGGRRWRR